MATVLGIVGVVLALIAIALTITAERLKHPRLDIRPSPFRPPGPLEWTFAAVRVHNRPEIPRPLGWFITRDAAVGCAVTVEFHRRDGTLAFHSVEGRWSSQPEPLRRQPVTGVPNVQQFLNAPQPAVQVTLADFY